MLILYEKLEEFLKDAEEILKRYPDLPAFTNIVRKLNQDTGIMSNEIYVQYQYNEMLVATHIFKELPNILNLDVRDFDHMFDGADAEKAKQKYELDRKVANQTVISEFEKMQDGLKSIGFKKIIKAIIQ